ncbi:MAG: hypothetical protein JST92_02360 [Deltaproteobacteria bacterium]|nr:hypothetical protein [Deltaproteobacteria bacterium]
MLLQRALDIAPDETAETLFGKLATLSAEVLAEGLPLLEQGKLVRTPQEHAKHTLAPILSRDDGRIDWNRTALEIDQRRRGFFPWPGAWTQLPGGQFKIHQSVVLDETTQLKPGEIVRAQAAGIDIACGGGTVLRLTEVQPENKKRMPAHAFLAGHPLAAGTPFAA